MVIYQGSIPSRINKIGDIVEDALSCLQNRFPCLDADFMFDFKVILSEIVINAVKHGNKENPDKLVRVLIGLSEENSLCISVQDEGDGYDLDVPCRDGPVFESEVCRMMESGRGIRLVKGLCDTLSVDGDGKTIVTMKLRKL